MKLTSFLLRAALKNHMTFFYCVVFVKKIPEKDLILGAKDRKYLKVETTLSFVPFDTTMAVILQESHGFV